MNEWDKFINDETVPVVVANDTGSIVRVNALFEKTFSWKAPDLIGQPISNIIPQNLRDAHNMGFSRYRLSGTSKLLNTPLDLEILTGAGEVEMAQHYITSHQENGSHMFAARITPQRNQ